MEVTSADLRAQCAAEHGAFLRCATEHGADAAAARCRPQRAALESCANATLAMVREINAHCAGLYHDYAACCKGSRELSECRAQQDAFWHCAQQHSSRALVDGDEAT